MHSLPLDMMFFAIDQAAYAQFRQQAAVKQRAILMTRTGMLDHPLDWQDGRERAAQLTALQARIRRVKPLRYALIGEAWVTNWNNGDAPLPPSKSEIREECLYVLVCDEDGESVLGYRKIAHVPFTGIAGPVLGKLVLEKAVSGPFAGFLP